MSRRSGSSPGLWLHAIPVVLAVAGLGCWEAMARNGMVSELFFPAPSVIVSTIFGMFEGGRLATDVSGTVTRLLAGFALGGSLRGAGDTRFPLYAILSGLFAVRLLGATIVANVLGGGVVAVWSCLLADYTTKAALLTWRFRSGAWKRVQV